MTLKNADWVQAAEQVQQTLGAFQRELFDQSYQEGNWAFSLQMLEEAMERSPKHTTGRIEPLGRVIEHLKTGPKLG